jgi:hypothetical protein
MRYVFCAAVAVFTFAIGVISHSAFQLREKNLTDIVPVSQLRQDELHRLYEAAGMSGDSLLRSAVDDRFLCMGWDDSLDARLVRNDTETYCVERDGSIRPQVFKDDHKNPFDVLLKSHISWSIKNLEFVESVKSPLEARKYVETHLPR